MSANVLTFSAIKVYDQNKEVKQDENGYYYVTLGALNCFNSSGAYYVADGVKDLIENESNLFAKRLANGYLNGEMGHPSFIPGMSHNDFLIRNLKIEQSNISHHIRSVELIPTDEDSGLPGGGKIIKVMGWVKPAGEKGAFLKEALDNPDQNVAFSVRSLTNDKPVKGVIIKKIMQIVTWDWVVEPGIKCANKWSTMSMESADLMTINIADIEKVVSENLKYGIGLEADNNDIRTMLKEVNQRIEINTTSVNTFNNW